MIKTEIERKFVLMGIPMEFVSIATKKEIVQYYVKESNPEGEGESREARYRKTLTHGEEPKTEFHRNTKVCMSPGINEETEDEVTESDFYDAIQNSSAYVMKTRWTLDVSNDRGDYKFELDVYSDFNMKVLEIECPKIDEPFDELPFPKGLREVVMAEVTGNNGFSNSSIAKSLFDLRESGVQFFR